MQRKGTIYTECHNKGRRRKGGVGGCVLRKGVGLVRSHQYRWVAEISYHGKRCYAAHPGLTIDYTINA